MYSPDLYSHTENFLKEENKNIVKEVAQLLKGKNIDDALSILFATRKLIVNASNPRVIDDQMLESFSL